jgi:hypothetical protein
MAKPTDEDLAAEQRAELEAVKRKSDAFLVSVKALAGLSDLDRENVIRAIAVFYDFGDLVPRAGA